MLMLGCVGNNGCLVLFLRICLEFETAHARASYCDEFGKFKIF